MLFWIVVLLLVACAVAAAVREVAVNGHRRVATAPIVRPAGDRR